MISVRLATDQDYEAIFSLACDFATSFQVQRDAFDVVFGHVGNEDSLWLGVAEGEGEVIGYLLGLDHFTFYANGRVAWVEEVMVHQDWRKRGVGQALMGSFEDWSFSRGSKLIGLATRRASEFYRRIGYEESATYFRKLIGESDHST